MERYTIVTSVFPYDVIELSTSELVRLSEDEHRLMQCLGFAFWDVRYVLRDVHVFSFVYSVITCALSKMFIIHRCDDTMFSDVFQPLFCLFCCFLLIRGDVVSLQIERRSEQHGKAREKRREHCPSSLTNTTCCYRRWTCPIRCRICRNSMIYLGMDMVATKACAHGRVLSVIMTCILRCLSPSSRCHGAVK